MRTLNVVVIAAVSIMAGCSALPNLMGIGRPFDADKAQTYEEGRATISDVLQGLGSPEGVQTSRGFSSQVPSDLSGRVTMIYMYTGTVYDRGSHVGPMGFGGSASGVAHSDDARFVFQDGHLVSKQVNASMACFEQSGLIIMAITKVPCK